MPGLALGRQAYWKTRRGTAPKSSELLATRDSASAGMYDYISWQITIEGFCSQFVGTGLRCVGRPVGPVVQVYDTW